MLANPASEAAANRRGDATTRDPWEEGCRKPITAPAIAARAGSRPSSISPRASEMQLQLLPEARLQEILHRLRSPSRHRRQRDYARLQGSPSNWPEGDINHYMCPHCGAHTFSRGYLEFMGGNFWAVNVACLDDATEEELGAAPDHLRGRQARPADGRHPRSLPTFDGRGRRRPLPYAVSDCRAGRLKSARCAGISPPASAPCPGQNWSTMPRWISCHGV